MFRTVAIVLMVLAVLGLAYPLLVYGWRETVQSYRQMFRRRK